MKIQKMPSAAMSLARQLSMKVQKVKNESGTKIESNVKENLLQRMLSKLKKKADDSISIDIESSPNSSPGGVKRKRSMMFRMGSLSKPRSRGLSMRRMTTDLVPTEKNHLLDDDFFKDSPEP